MKLKFIIILYTLLLTLASLNANKFDLSTNDLPASNVKIELPSSLIVGKQAKLKVSYVLPSGYYTTKDNIFIKLTSNDPSIKLGLAKITTKPINEKYSGLVEFSQDITITKNLSNNTLSLIASYQLCNEDGVCFLPKSVPLSPLVINLSEETIDWQLILGLLLLSYLGGLVLNFMPCVLPIIMLKIYAVLGISQKKERFNYMLSYSLGLMVGIFGLAIFVVVLKSLGHMVGWGEQWQNGYFVLAMFVFLLLILLNLLDILPLNIGFFGGKNSSAMLQGLFTLLLSTPCSAPFLGLALVGVIDKPAPIVFLAFALIGLGLLTPFWLLPHLPKKWQEGFTNHKYLATILKYIAITALVLLLRWLLSLLLPKLNLIYFGLGILFFISSIYALNSATIHSYTKKWFIKTILIIALALSSYSLYTSYNHNHQVIVKISEPWQPYSAKKVSLDLENNRPVLVVFTASWCLSCRYNDYTVFQNKELLDFFKVNNIALYKADLSYTTSTEADNLLKQINRNSLPSYALYDKNGKLTGMGNLISKNKIMEYYNKL